MTIIDEAFTGISHVARKLSCVPSVYYSMSNDETRIAEQIISVLPAGIARAFSADRETIRYAVRADGLKLRMIILCRESLRRLIADPVRDVKIEYLQRDLIRSAGARSEFHYPRPHLHPLTITKTRFRFGLPLASMV